MKKNYLKAYVQISTIYSNVVEKHEEWKKLLHLAVKLPNNESNHIAKIYHNLGVCYIQEKKYL